MDQDTVKAKSLELIHLTKEFLQLKKTYEDSLSVLILVRKAKMLGDTKLDTLPEKVLAFVKTAGNLDDAEKMTTARMSLLRDKMQELSPEIKKLSDQLEPYFSSLRESSEPKP